MVDKLKNYILWPILALLATLAIYLLLVLSIHKILIYSSASEETLWNSLIVNNVTIIDKHVRGEQAQMIVDRLAEDLLPSQYPKVKIIVIKDENINAAAAPGGRIILTTGLLEALKSENALLFVIGHEIGHLMRKDHLYQFSRMLVAKLYGFLTFSKVVPELLMLIDLTKTREVEFLADQWALKIILYYYGHVEGMDEFFQILLADDKENISKSILSSHPLTSKRLDKLMEIIKAKKLK